MLAVADCWEELIVSFSVGSGRLRTSAARAGLSFCGSRAWTCVLRWLDLRRYHRKREIERAKRRTAPTIPPAKAPLLTPPPDFEDPGPETQVVWLHV